MLYSHISDLSLPSEIILMVIEALEYEQGLLEKLMCISKDFRRLIKVNETSIVAHFSRHYERTNFPLTSSKTTSARLSLHPRTIPWLNEAYQRAKITSEIQAQHPSLIIGITRYFQNTALEPLARVMLLFDGLAIGCLNIPAVFRIFDSRKTTSFYGCSSQRNVIKSMRTFELACVSILLYATSIQYSSRSRWRGCPLGNEIHAQTVFREMVLKYGPYFIWAANCGSPADKLWVERRIVAGMAQLKAYEQGVNVLEYVLPNSSVQAVIMKELHRRGLTDMHDILIWVFAVLYRRLRQRVRQTPHNIFSGL